MRTSQLRSLLDAPGGRRHSAHGAEASRARGGNSIFLGALYVLLVTTSCGDGSPSSSDPPPPPAGANLAVFSSPTSSFSTTDVRDSDDQIVRFDLDTGSLIWLPDSLAFDGWVVDGNFLGEGRPYQVRFGTVSGQPRAYFTETGRGTICDLEVENNFLTIQPTNELPPAS